MTTAAQRAERFWDRCESVPMTGCLLWTGALNHKGYGLVWSGERVVVAHRYAWTLVVGSIPEGRWVLHHCDVRACVNPNHLFLGTATDNTADMTKKGRDAGRFEPGHVGHGRKLSDDQVRELRRLSDEGWRRFQLAERFGVSKTTARDLLNGVSYREVS